MAALDVVSHKSVIQEPRNVSGKQVHGVGGVCDITHKGFVPAFGIEMQYIEGGVNPSLSSVAKSVRVNKDGDAGAAIFLPNGAVRIRTDGVFGFICMHVLCIENLGYQW